MNTTFQRLRFMLVKQEKADFIAGFMFLLDEDLVSHHVTDILTFE